MHMSSADATLVQIKKLHAKWVAAALSSEDALFQISDVIERHHGAAWTDPARLTITADQPAA